VEYNENKKRDKKAKEKIHDSQNSSSSELLEELNND